MSNLMSFEEFTEEVRKNVLDYLPMEYADAKIDISESRKINSAYQGMTIKKEGQKIAAAVNLNEMYDKYQKTGELKPLLYEIAEIAVTQPEGVDVQKLESYEQAKDSLFIRACNAGSNKELLETVPHEIVGDLAMTFHVMLGRDEEGYGSAIVSNEILEKFGVGKGQLKADALENSAKILSPSLEPMSNVMARMLGMQNPDLRMTPFETAIENFDFKQDNMFVLSNMSAVNGASTIFYPKVMEQIGDHAGGDFFVIPSSVHEVILVPDDGVMNRNDLENIIRDINAHEVDPKDRLSDSLYHYDSKEHRLERAVDFEERQERETSLGKAEKVSIKDRLKDAEAKVQEQKTVSRPQKEQTIG